MMSTPPPASPDPGSVWPPPPTQPDTAPLRAPFASLLPLATAVTILLAIELGGLIGTHLIKNDPTNLSAAMTRLMMLLAYGVALVAARIVFLRWVFVAYKNLNAFETAGLETTAGWAVGWFFVPIINLYRPYMVFHELWKAGSPGVDSRDEIAWQQIPSTPLLGGWWAAQLLNLYFPLMIDKVLTHGLTDTASSILKVVLGTADIALTITVVTLISRRQEAKAKALAPKPHSYL